MSGQCVRTHAGGGGIFVHFIKLCVVAFFYPKTK